jgi:CubicO group peptidase (beta-lactamase class C family)
VRDLLVHRSGLSLGAGDLLWWPPVTYTRAEAVRRLRHLPLATSFRGSFAYDNVLYLVAGEVVEAMSGQPWEDFVTERILRPLGMDETTPRIGEGYARANLALPHARVDGLVRSVTPFASEVANPAAGLVTNAHDIARWLTVQLDSGRVDTGVRLFAPRTAEELWGLVTPIPVTAPPPELAAARMQFYGYALGFFVRDYRGNKVVSHTGGLPGYVSQVTLVPALRLGVAVFTNQESGGAFRAVTNYIVDYYLGVDDTDWIAAYRAAAARQEAETAAAERAILAARDSLSGPSLPLAAYAGTYADPWYGDVTITEGGDGLVMRFGATPLLVGDLENWQHDTFVVRWRDRTLRADAFVTFALNPDGSVARATMQPVSPATDFSFDFQDLVLMPAAE